MKKSFLLLFLFLVPIAFTMAQEVEENKSSSDLSLNIAIKNRHLWRCGVGIDGLSVQSTLQYSYKTLRIGAWGAYELDAKSYEEVDLFLEWDFAKNFTFGLYDFYYPSGKTGRMERDFSHFKNSPNHAVDAFISYSGTEQLPLGFVVGAYVYGGADQDEKGDQKYSNYFELNYTLSLKNDRSVKFYVGATAGEDSAYASRDIEDNGDFNIIGLGAKYTKGFKVGNFDASMSGEFLYNPNIDGVYMAIAASIDF